MKKLYFKSIDSTNSYLKSNYQSIDHMTWLSTDFQSAGKGRTKKKWFGNKDSLMCSILLKENINDEHIQLLPLLAAKTLHTVLSTYDKNILIKWPNDLLINHQKLAGILVESIYLSNQVLAVVIGFGVNINNQHFDDELKDIATSLSLTTQATYDKEIIYHELMNQFDKDYQLFTHHTQFIIDYCNQYNALLNQMISFTDQNEIKQAKVLQIQNDGTLLVSLNNGNIALSSGEISILK